MLAPVVLLLTVCLLAILASGAVVRQAARGRLFNEIAAMPHRSVGLVLGCSARLGDGRPNLFFAYRMGAAVQLYRAGKVDFLIVSGDNHVAGYDEPIDMKRALVAAGLPPDRIYRDYAGFRTLDSVVRAKEVFGQSGFTVISQDFHNERALYIARSRGIDAIGFNARSVKRYDALKTRLREQLARVRTVIDVLLGAGPKFLGPRIAIGPAEAPSAPL